MKIQEPSRSYGVWVRAITTTRVTLEARSPRQDIGHPGTLGIHWENGYGQVGEVLDVVDNRVTRSFTLLKGSPMEPCTEANLEDCEPVDLEGYAFPSDPSDRGLQYEETTYRSPLGEFGAWVVPANSGHSWAIHVHGWTATRRETIRSLTAFHKAGFTSMVINYRGDADSPADPTGHYRFGLSEWAEVEAAVSYAREQDATQIVLMGYSTGAALVMSFLEQSDQASTIQGVILDSPNIILADAVRANTSDARFPVIGLRMTELMKEFGMWVADMRWKIDWERTNYVQRASSFLEVPALVFHGTSDQRVPIDISRQFEARVRDHVTLIEAPAAGHVMSWNASPEEYETRLQRFLEDL